MSILNQSNTLVTDLKTNFENHELDKYMVERVKWARERDAKKLAESTKKWIIRYWKIVQFLLIANKDKINFISRQKTKCVYFIWIACLFKIEIILVMVTNGPNAVICGKKKVYINLTVYRMIHFTFNDRCWLLFERKFLNYFWWKWILVSIRN